MSNTRRIIASVAKAVCSIGLLCVVSGCSGQSELRPLPPLDSVRAVAPSTDYRLQPGDALRIKFEFHPEHDIKVPVRPDGRITLDVTGDLVAAGLTAAELEAAIKQQSSKRLREPEVTVIVAQLGEQKIFVGGEVRLPGFVVYRTGMTPMQAILDRGGFSDTARIDSVLHISPGDSDYRAVRLDMTEVVENGAPEASVLAANDVLFVPRTFIGDAGAFVRLYIRDLLPIPPRLGFAP